MKRLILAICLALVGGSGIGLVAHPAYAASLCVGSGPGCYPSIQQALSVAQNGDVIRVGPGSFPGGITINLNLSIIGAGAGVTTIRGGGPVVTIGDPNATSEPTVSLSGVTITGGSNISVPTLSQPRGGGVWVPGAADGGPGATVTISNSIITGNTVRASAAGDCGPGCTFAFSRGGGIASFGTITLTNSVVSNNRAIFDLSLASGFSGAYGGGIKNNGTLTLRNSTVSGNIAEYRTAGVNQDGRSAQGGGIDSNGPLTMDGSTVSNNTVSMTSTSTDAGGGVFGVGAGVNIEETGSGTIRDTVIRGNTISATGYTGGNGDGGAGIDADGPLLLVGSLVSGNQATSTSTTLSAGQVSGSTGGGIEGDAPITIMDTTISDNSAMTTGDASVAFAMGAALANGIGQTVTISDSRITGNTAAAATTSGVVFLEGAAIHNDTGTMTLRNTVVSNNTGTASGSSGVAEGGGIYNGPATFFCPDCTAPPPHQLILDDSAITQNTVSATSQSITVHGGGVFNDTYQQATATVNDTVIARNVPDQCYGC